MQAERIQRYLHQGPDSEGYKGHKVADGGGRSAKSQTTGNGTTSDSKRDHNPRGLRPRHRPGSSPGAKGINKHPTDGVNTGAKRHAEKWRIDRLLVDGMDEEEDLSKDQECILVYQ